MEQVNTILQEDAKAREEMEKALEVVGKEVSLPGVSWQYRFDKEGRPGEVEGPFRGGDEAARVIGCVLPPRIYEEVQPA